MLCGEKQSGGRGEGDQRRKNVGLDKDSKINNKNPRKNGRIGTNKSLGEIIKTNFFKVICDAFFIWGGGQRTVF